MSKVIDEDGNAQTYKAVYYRHMVKYSEECDSLEDAYEYLIWGKEDGYLSTIGIKGPDGQMTMDRDAFDAARRDAVKPEDLIPWVNSYVMKEIEK